MLPITGYWLPWDPEPSKVAKQEYGEKELNELIHKYEENQEARKVAFNKRVEREMEDAKKKNEANKKALEASKEQSVVADDSVQQENVLDEVMEQKDAWSQRQSQSKDTTPTTDSSESKEKVE